MAKGVRYLKTKTVVKTAALDMFLGDFAPEHMIRALIDLCELARTHPDFGKAGQLGEDAYAWADEATDHLHSFFLESDAFESGSEGAPQIVVDYQAGAIELMKVRYRRRRPLEPCLSAATRAVPVRLATRPGARN